MLAGRVSKAGATKPPKARICMAECRTVKETFRIRDLLEVEETW